ncbi:MAG TPA: glycosyltransferase [Aliidongia sp.]|nr:glycosyltransferase [Aliidongia sp.]
MRLEAPCRIRHVDLAEGIPDLPAEPGAKSLLVIFWWGRVPLGSDHLSTAELPLPRSAVLHRAARLVTAAVGDRLFDYGFKACLPVHRRRMPEDRPPDLAALNGAVRPLATIARGPDVDREDTAAPRPSVSLIICTRDRPDALKRCLMSVAQADGLDQVVVVDNNPGNRATRRVVDGFPGVAYLAEPRPGLSVARNAGLAATRGEIVLFTDDDVVIEPDWPLAMVRAFIAPEIMAVAGLVLPAELESAAQIAFEQELGGFGQGFRAMEFDAEFFSAMKSRGVPVWRLGSGANMGFRRTVFDRVGLFDERLGAGASGCSEDSELWYRLLAIGARCRYEPSAVVHHYHRADWATLTHQVRAYTKGHVVALFVQYWRWRHAGNLRRVFTSLPYYYLWLVKEGCRRGFGLRQRLLPSELVGWCAGLWAALALWRRGAHVGEFVAVGQTGSETDA